MLSENESLAGTIKGIFGVGDYDHLNKLAAAFIAAGIFVGVNAVIDQRIAAQTSASQTVTAKAAPAPGGK